MTIYLDSALIPEAQAAKELGWVSGITTNPTLLAQSKLPPEDAVAARIAGSQTLSLPFQVLLALGEHELSHQTVAEFLSKGLGIQQ